MITILVDCSPRTLLVCVLIRLAYVCIMNQIICIKLRLLNVTTLYLQLKTFQSLWKLLTLICLALFRTILQTLACGIKLQKLLPTKNPPLLLWPGGWRCAVYLLELQTNLREEWSFTIIGPTKDFTFMTLCYAMRYALMVG